MTLNLSLIQNCQVVISALNRNIITKFKIFVERLPKDYTSDNFERVNIWWREVKSAIKTKAGHLLPLHGISTESQAAHYGN